MATATTQTTPDVEIDPRTARALRREAFQPDSRRPVVTGSSPPVKDPVCLERAEIETGGTATPTPKNLAKSGSTAKVEAPEATHESTCPLNCLAVSV